jgi:Lrp/AsnC family transcriptional regulator, regulator for asnA, asnC and gidA
MNDIRLDEIDRKLIDELRRDGRLAHTELGRRIGVSESTIRKRLHRLVRNGIIEIAARVNLTRLGFDLSVIMQVLCHPGERMSVADALATFPEVRFISIVAQQYDIHASASLSSRIEVVKLLEKIGKIPGIQRVNTFFELQVIKRAFFFSDLDNQNLSVDNNKLAIGDQEFS